MRKFCFVIVMVFNFILLLAFHISLIIIIDFIVLRNGNPKIYLFILYVIAHLITRWIGIKLLLNKYIAYKYKN